MSIIQGDVVLATAGKEKGNLFIAWKVDEKYCYLVDGKRLKIDKPKKKSLKHVYKASKISFPEKSLCEKEEKVNAEIRKFLKERKNHVETRCH